MNCYGTADEVEIQVALDALPTTGGEVSLLARPYILDGSIVLGPYQALIGCGPETVIKIRDNKNERR